MMINVSRTFLICLLASLCACAPLNDTAHNRPAAQAVVAGAAAPERLFLQQLGSHSVIVKWRGDAQLACWATASEGLDAATCKQAVVTQGNHREAKISGLEPDTQYLYSVGGYAANTLRFRTAPLRGQLPEDGSVQIWIVGDSGTESSPENHGHSNKGKAAQVLAGYQRYRAQNNSKATDMMLMLGDNAYTEGTDAQWQLAVFDVYTDVISQTPLWSTIGNHEMGAGLIDAAALGEKYAKLAEKTGGKLLIGGVSTTSNPDAYITADNRIQRRMPYLDILTLPAQAELGGVPSNTEQYYSFDHGNVHVVSLDSQLSARDSRQRNAMKQWLEADLQQNTMDWTVVIFHHPVYTKGSHDSDTEAASRMGIDQPIIDMRVEFTPIFEEYGVDLVFSGHSHSYERSWYLHGHRGDAATFDATQHAELNRSGEPAIGHGSESYEKISIGSKRDDKVVYTVAGSSGHVSLRGGKLNHPAHAIQKNDPQQRHGLAELGSVVVEVTAAELNAHFINEKGAVLDTVTIRRNGLEEDE